MKESNELFELCRQVYEATGWMPVKDQYLTVFEKDGDKCLWVYDNCCWRTLDDSEEDAGYVPLYTSDYLLEKLPRQIEDVPLCLWAAGRSDWMAEYDGTGQFEGVNERISMLSDTPLKALLSLTLKLHEEGLL